MRTMNYTRMDKQVICFEVKQALTKTGLTQQKFAQRIGCTESQLSHWLTGVYPPSKAWCILMQEATQLVLKEHAEGRV